MEKVKTAYGADKKTILEALQKNPMNQMQLDKLGIRQNIRRALRLLLQNGQIRVYIKPKKLPKVKPVGILKEEIFFSIAPNEFPQDLLELKKRIEAMCEGDTVAYEDFINLCIEREIPRNDAIKIAYDLIAELHPDLKAKIVFELAYYKEPSIILESYNDETKERVYSIPDWRALKIKNYDYFLKK